MFEINVLMSRKMGRADSVSKLKMIISANFTSCLNKRIFLFVFLTKAIFLKLHNQSKSAGKKNPKLLFGYKEKSLQLHMFTLTPPEILILTNPTNNKLVVPKL